MNRRQFNRNALAISLATAFPIVSRLATAGPDRRIGEPPSFGPPQRPALQKPRANIPAPHVPAHALNVRSYGARGDGKANDTEAFAAAADEINRRGGGILYIPAGTYLVGKQTGSGAIGKGYAYRAKPIIEIKNCPRPVTVMGGAGAKLAALPGLKFGAFDPATGQAFTASRLPFLDHDFRADAYIMLNLHNNAEITVTNLELDGGLQHLALGGEWGDTGRQTDATGMYLANNKKVTVKNVHTHHHGLDGIEIAHYGLTPESAPTPMQLFNVTSEYNGRQGLSWVGGIGLTAINCKFNHTGTVRFCSQPGAGLDIEEEASTIRAGYFLNCEFANNAGWGIQSMGNTAHVLFENCSIWGTRSWSMWPNVPYLAFRKCDIHGQMKKVYSDAGNPASACRFTDCIIDDAPHPKYGPVYGATPLIDLSEYPSSGVTYDGCHITSLHGKSFYTVNTDRQKPIIIKNCTITHGGQPLDSDSLCLLSGAYLDNVHFRETYRRPPHNRYQITIRNSTIASRVVVDGPFVTASVRPFTGKLDEGRV